MPTAPIGAACPSWPTTPVSTAPRIGIVALESTIGTATRSTRRWVIGASHPPPLRHQEVPGRLGEEPGAVVLPGLDVHAMA